MMRDWEPGDVAMRVDGDTPRVALRVARCAHSSLAGEPHWHYTSESLTVAQCGSDRSAAYHPVVVVDPEDREQVRRLLETYGRQFSSWTPELDTNVTRLQAALRALIEPPRQPEPTDPKARVSDLRDNIWRLLADGDWVCTSGPDIGEYLVWRQLEERGPLTIEGVTR